MKRERILGIIRHTLTFVGGVFVMKGVVDETMAQEIIGGIVTLTGTIWSLLSKK